MKDSGKKQPPLSGTSPPAKHKKSRFFLKLFLGLTSLFALLIILILSVDLNTFREPVAKALSQATGMKIKIEFLDWSFSEGLKIDCRGVQIFSGETEEELLSTKELRVSLNWLPLLEQRVVVDSISLVGPVLKIAVNPSSTNDSLPPLKKISGSDANSSSSSPSLNQPSSPDRLQNVRELLKNPNFSLTAINLIAGRVILQERGTGKEIALETEARMQIQRDERRVGLILEDIRLGTGKLMAEGDIRTDDFLSAESPLQTHIRFSPFKVSDLLPVLEWVPKFRDAIYRKLKLKGQIQTLDLKLNTPVDSVMDLDSLMSSADAALILKGNELSLVQYGNTISASTLDTNIQLKDQQWAHKMVLGILGGNVESQGQLFLRKGSNDADDWRLDSKLILAKINLRDLKTQFFKQSVQFPEEGTLSANIRFRGPALHPQLIQGEGNISAQNLTFPVNGTVISVADLEGKGKWLGDRLNHQFYLTALGGEITLKGDLKLDKDNRGQWNPVIDTDLVSKSIQLNSLRPLVQKAWFPEKGTVTGKVHVQGPVLRPESLQAEGKIEILDTAIRHQGTSVPIAAINGTGRWIKNRLAHDLKMKVFGGNLQIKGNLKLNKTLKGELDPVIDSDVISQSVQLASLRPLIQKDWFPEKGTLTGKVHIQGPVLRPETFQSQGRIKVLNMSLNLKDGSMPIPEMELIGQWVNNQLTHDLKVEVLDGSLQAIGVLFFNKGSNGKLTPVIDSKIFIRPVYLSRLKPLIAKDWFPEKGTLEGVIHVYGPLLLPSGLKADGKLRVRNTTVSFGGNSIDLIQAEAKGLWADQHLSHHVQLNVFGGEVFLQGNVDFRQNDQGELDPMIDTHVTPKDVKLSALKPLIAKDWFPESGTLVGSIYIKGPIKRNSDISLQGNLVGKNVALKFKEKSVTIENTLLTFKSDTRENIHIGADLSHILIGKLSLKKSVLKGVYSKTNFELKQSKIWAKTGEVLLKGAYAFETQDYKLSVLGQKLRAEEFLGEHLKGSLSLQGSIYGKILREGFKKGLSGNFDISTQNSSLLKVGVILTKILNTLNIKLFQGNEEGIPVDFIGGEGIIKDGVVSTKNFRMLTPSLKLWVTGKADLSDETINAEVMALPMQRANHIIGALKSLIANTQSDEGDGGLLKNTINKVPIVGEALAGKEGKKGLIEDVFKIIPFVGDKRKKGDPPDDLIKVYFSVDGTFNKPYVYFLPQKTFMLR